jgi:hypothetical protein
MRAQHAALLIAGVLSHVLTCQHPQPVKLAPSTPAYGLLKLLVQHTVLLVAESAFTCALRGAVA